MGVLTRTWTNLNLSLPSSTRLRHPSGTCSCWSLRVSCFRPSVRKHVLLCSWSVSLAGGLVVLQNVCKFCLTPIRGLRPFRPADNLSQKTALPDHRACQMHPWNQFVSPPSSGHRRSGAQPIAGCKEEHNSSTRSGRLPLVSTCACIFFDSLSEGSCRHLCQPLPSHCLFLALPKEGCHSCHHPGLPPPRLCIVVFLSFTTNFP